MVTGQLLTPSGMKLYTELQEILADKYKIDISGFSTVFIEKTLADRMQQKNCNTLNMYRDFLLQDAAEASEFSDCLNITYSEFFRSPLVFSILEQIILPRLIATKEDSGANYLRIWSAGCASGQEPYSLAMISNDVLRKKNSRVTCRVFATDISFRELETAAKGEYYIENLENVRLKNLNRFFIKNGNKYRVNDEIRELVSFSQHNLAEGESFSPPESIFGDFDIIMCSNVLLYYNTEVQSGILRKFMKSLSRDGFLITGDEEAGILKQYYMFNPLMIASPVFYL